MSPEYQLGNHYHIYLIRVYDGEKQFNIVFSELGENTKSILCKFTFRFQL